MPPLTGLMVAHIGNSASVNLFGRQIVFGHPGALSILWERRQGDRYKQHWNKQLHECLFNHCFLTFWTHAPYAGRFESKWL